MGKGENETRTVKYQISIQAGALRMIEAIHDRRVQEKIRDRIDALATEPDKQGKPLLGELSRLRAVRAVGQRYRIIYQVEKEKVIVIVIAIGLRKEDDKGDIYTLAKKLIQLRLF